jgi:hypothetical protein
MAETGAKRPAEHQLHPEDEAGPGAARHGAGDDVEAPFSDVKPAIQPSDVHVLLADDEKISRLVTSKLLRMCVAHRLASRGAKHRQGEGGGELCAAATEVLDLCRVPKPRG